MKRPHSSNPERISKYLMKSTEYIYSPIKKKNSISREVNTKMIAIQNCIERAFSSINRNNNVKNVTLKNFKNIARTSSPYKNTIEKIISNSQVIKEFKEMEKTPKNSSKKSNNYFMSTTAKSLVNSNLIISKNPELIEIEKIRNRAKEKLTLQNSSDLIEFYQKLCEEQNKDKNILNKLILKLKKEISIIEKDRENLNDNSKKILDECDKEKKCLDRQEKINFFLNKDINTTANDINNISKEIELIKNINEDLKNKGKEEKGKIKEIISFQKEIKVKITQATKNKEKTKFNLMIANKRLLGLKEKIDELEKESEIFIKGLQKTNCL